MKGLKRNCAKWHKDFEVEVSSSKLGVVATNNGLGGPGSNRDLFCIVSTNVV